MNRKDNKILLENIDFSRPSFDCVEAFVFEFWIEECIEAVYRG